MSVDGLYEDVRSELARTGVAGKKLKLAVKTSSDRDALQRLLDDPRTPDYIRMYAKTRLSELGSQHATDRRARLHRALDRAIDAKLAKAPKPAPSRFSDPAYRKAERSVSRAERSTRKASGYRDRN